MSDSSILENPGNGGIKGFIRNSKEDWVLGFSQRFMQALNNFMEFMVLKQGL